MKLIYIIFIVYWEIFNVHCLEEAKALEEKALVETMYSDFEKLGDAKKRAVSQVKNDVNMLDDSKASKILNMYNFVRDPAVHKLLRDEVAKSKEKKRFTHIKRSAKLDKSNTNVNRPRMFLKLCLKGAHEEKAVKRLCKRMAILEDLAGGEGDESSANAQELLTHLYEWEAKVQVEANEVVRLQQIASAAQHSLEEATNKVRVLSAELQAEQNATKILAENAHNVQVQLANHDQLLYEARQKVSELSNEMVELEESLAGNAVSDTSSLDTSKNIEPEEEEAPAMHCFGPNC